MKNFPHQHTQFERLRAALEAVRDLNDSGADSSDDGVLGDKLARGQVHRFRSIDYKNTTRLKQRIERQLVREHHKPKSNQGSRTAARENRKTLEYLGWLHPQRANLTVAGEALLDSETGSVQEMDIIRAAIVQIELSDGAGNKSHPVLHLLGLISNVNLYSRVGMELALEAKDDTAAEFQRIVMLAQLTPQDLKSTLNASGVSDFKIANARKILPVFVENCGLIQRNSANRYVVTVVGQQLCRQKVVLPRTRSTASSRRSRYTANRRIISTSNPSRVGRPRTVMATTLHTTRSKKVQLATAKLLSERTARHQNLVRMTATHCSRRRSDCKFSEDAASYDLVIYSLLGGPVDLMEVKTIRNDAVSQVRLALGQLLYYEHFFVSRRFRNRIITRSVVVDKAISLDLARFLESNSIGLLVVTNSSVRAQNRTAKAIAKRRFL